MKLTKSDMHKATAMANLSKYDGLISHYYKKYVSPFGLKKTALISDETIRILNRRDK